MWASSTLSGLIRNRAYMGTAEYFRHETVAPPRPGRAHGRQQLRPGEDWIRVPVPAIITDETFEAAQRVKTRQLALQPTPHHPGHYGCCAAWSTAAAAASRPRVSAVELNRGQRHHEEPLLQLLQSRRDQARRRPTSAAPSGGSAPTNSTPSSSTQVREILLRPDVLLAGERALIAREPAPDDEILTAQLAKLNRRLDQTAAERRRSPTSTKPGTST